MTLTCASSAQAKGPSVKAELTRLQDAGQLDAPTADGYRTAYDDARETLRRLSGFRRVQLRAVIRNVDAAASGHLFIPTRLKAEFLTLQRNREYWPAHPSPLPRAGQRTTFAGSQIVWQFYPGQGWQIQWLGTFGKANALWMVKTRDDDLRRLLDEALGLATQRAGGIAFEYLFTFDGGRPPWVSGLAQGTALSALSRGAVRLRDNRYFDAARTALGIFKTPPPTGVLRRTSNGSHYLQYSYAPRLRIVNGFTQSLNGLHDFAALANDAEGRALFAAGEKALRAELPGFDTGAWSLYSKPGAESDLGYHKVLRDFLRGLCDRLGGSGAQAAQVQAPPAGATTPAPAATADPKLYCDTARRFTADLTTKPKLEITAPAKALRAKVDAHVPFTLSKIATVTITATRAGQVVLSRTARLAYGKHYVSIKPSRAGPLLLRVAATDLAGNGNAAQATVHVRAAAKKHRGV
ncbi:D-glucuronyl C5-epimerase family protein [Baekduia alba]|uniref:D-glucuronyl C5-epimerase family protein n=1 Tax=Baekduia alba TaxID=2997333 RepID=UPI0023420CC3|nr:D-glucuronyl C5-epimerase family protein [Baekduia alba]